MLASCYGHSFWTRLVFIMLVVCTQGSAQAQTQANRSATGYPGSYGFPQSSAGYSNSYGIAPPAQALPAPVFVQPIPGSFPNYQRRDGSREWLNRDDRAGYQRERHSHTDDRNDRDSRQSGYRSRQHDSQSYDRQEYRYGQRDSSGSWGQ